MHVEVIVGINKCTRVKTFVKRVHKKQDKIKYYIFNKLCRFPVLIVISMTLFVYHSPTIFCWRHLQVSGLHVFPNSIHPQFPWVSHGSIFSWKITQSLWNLFLSHGVSVHLVMHAYRITCVTHGFFTIAAKLVCSITRSFSWNNPWIIILTGPTQHIHLHSMGDLFTFFGLPNGTSSPCHVQLSLLTVTCTQVYTQGLKPRSKTSVIIMLSAFICHLFFTIRLALSTCLATESMSILDRNW